MSNGIEHARETRARIGLLKPAVGFLRPYWRRVIAASAALVFTAGVSLSLGQGMRILVDEGFVSGSQQQLNHAVLVFMGIVLLLSLAILATRALRASNEQLNDAAAAVSPR